jgi:hypothetical protein
MLDAKMVADLITATRGILGLVMIWLGLTQGEGALPMVVLIMLLDWTGDFVDGTLAKRSRHPRRTRIGDSDIYVDFFMSVCLGIYLISAGFAGLTLGLCYLLGWTLIFWRFGLEKNLLMLAQTPIYLWFIVLSMQLHPELGRWMILWVLVALAINWRRFSKEIVPAFIRAMMSLGRGRHS